ncbi:MAG TPA: PAS domain S-box protein [Syntrophales bacterium]|nr:PAS domain S-box protein [Syntrophales bacterium]
MTVSVADFTKKNLRVPVWLTTLIVIIMIIMFSLVINQASIRESAEQYGKQYMTIAKGTAAGIDDLFESVEKSLIILSRHHGGITHSNMREAFDDLQGKIELLAINDQKGKAIEAYPKTFPDKILKDISDSPAFIKLVQDIKETGKTAVSSLISVDLKRGNGQEKEYKMVIIGVPEFDLNKKYAGFVYAALSPSSVVERYINITKTDVACDAMIVDDTETVLFHPKSEYIGADINAVIRGTNEQPAALKEGILKDTAGYDDYELLQTGGMFEKSIVGYAPAELNNRRWYIAVSTPYHVAISQIRKTFFIIMLEALVLIITVIIGSVLVARSGRKHLLLEEELRHLRDRELWREQLAREKKTLEGIIEGSPIPTFVIDRDHRIIFWNKACTELMGYESRDMMGTDKQYLPFYHEKRPVIADLIVDNDTLGLEKFYGEKSLHKSTVIEGAYEARDYFENMGGKSRHLYFLAAPIYDEKGDIIAAIETLQDVTKEEEMARGMREYAEFLSNEKRTVEGMIEGSPIPTFVIDRQHKIIFWNHACTELTGYDGKDMIGTDSQYLPFYPERRPVIADLIVDNDIEELDKYYGKKSVHKSRVVEGAYEASDFFDNLGGKSRHLYFLAAPIYDEKGEIIAAIETLQDVTKEEELTKNMKEYAESLSNEIYELIRLRTDLQELSNYLQSILDSSPDRIFAISSEGIINYVSRLSSVDDASILRQMKGRHFAEFVIPEYREFMLAKWEEVKKGIHKPFEIEATTRYGSKRNLLITTAPIKGTDRYILVQRDITEHKNLEKKFYESQKLAAVGQLSAGIAHEVRNPLSSIKMSLRILEKRLNPSGNDLKRFKIAEKEVEHLEKIVNDILIYAKPTGPERKPSDIGSFIEGSLSMVEKELSDKKIQVELHNDKNIPAVEIDPAMLRQAFLNIYLNAIDAMGQGGRLRIRSKFVADGDRHVVVEIEDSGYGIDAEDMPHLFNPFFTRKRYGTGLGLTQVKKFIDLHHGSIEIFSRKGEGTKVVVTLPLEENKSNSNTSVSDT